MPRRARIVRGRRRPGAPRLGGVDHRHEVFVQNRSSSCCDSMTSFAVAVIFETCTALTCIVDATASQKIRRFLLLSVLLIRAATSVTQTIGIWQNELFVQMRRRPEKSRSEKITLAISFGVFILVFFPIVIILIDIFKNNGLSSDSKPNRGIEIVLCFFTWICNIMSLWLGYYQQEIKQQASLQRVSNEPPASFKLTFTDWFNSSDPAVLGIFTSSAFFIKCALIQFVGTNLSSIILFFEYIVSASFSLYHDGFKELWCARHAEITLTGRLNFQFESLKKLVSDKQAPYAGLRLPENLDRKITAIRTESGPDFDREKFNLRRMRKLSIFPGSLVMVTFVLLITDLIIKIRYENYNASTSIQVLACLSNMIAVIGFLKLSEELHAQFDKIRLYAKSYEALAAIEGEILEENPFRMVRDTSRVNPLMLAAGNISKSK